MRVVGITGGIACGKSTVLQLLGTRGVATLSADDVAREVTSIGSTVLGHLVQAFGEGVLRDDGSLDRAALSEIVFEDEDRRRLLEEITHPAILELLKERIQSLANEGTFPAVAVEVPLLFEVGIEEWFDCVVVVAASAAVQIARLSERSGIRLNDATKRIASQAPLDEKIRRADVTIWNDGDLSSLSLKVGVLWTETLSSTKPVERWRASGAPEITQPK